MITHLLPKSQMTIAALCELQDGTSGVPAAPARALLWVISTSLIPSWHPCAVYNRLTFSALCLHHGPWYLCHHGHQLSCSMRVSIHEVNFPNGDSAMYLFAFVCLFTEHSGARHWDSQNRERRPRHLEAAISRGNWSLANDVKAHGNTEKEATLVCRMATSLCFSFVRDKHN